MSTPVTQHFSVAEFGCKDGTAYPIGNVEQDGRTWLESRLRPLCATLEVIREAAGGKPIRITSGFRSIAYNRKIGSNDRSQHPKGRAADIQHPSLTAEELHALVMRLYNSGMLPYLGGVGAYPSFCHVDVRPRGEDNHLARWVGSRTSNG